MHRHIYPEGYVDEDENRNITSIGLLDERKYQGLEISFLWIDEITSIKELTKVYNKCLNKVNKSDVSDAPNPK